MLSEMLTNKAFAHVKQKDMTCILNRYYNRENNTRDSMFTKVVYGSYLNGILMRTNNLSALTQCPTMSKTCHSMVQCNLRRKNVQEKLICLLFNCFCFVGFMFTVMDYFNLIYLNFQFYL